jgi:hypothetical protein
MPRTNASAIFERIVEGSTTEAGALLTKSTGGAFFVARLTLLQ